MNVGFSFIFLIMQRLESDAVTGLIPMIWSQMPEAALRGSTVLNVLVAHSSVQVENYKAQALQCRCSSTGRRKMSWV
ncbi:hypothetical protein J6590_026436 [Homalodisca vitripennis]|nr:hypothetical protein J6590_026436 [Homalodisca vitripennis]